ncbi:MAG: hypothetical protein HC763_12575 [Hydrococcus sp. CRU_1_1]|nr:hypothetical protein [Hydrococcus sp. CRU_1_1]
MKGQRGLSLVSTIVVNGEVLKGNGLATANEKTKKRDRSEGKKTREKEKLANAL